jgi:hypothetical protein
MKRGFILLFLFMIFSLNVVAEDIDNDIENIEQNNNEIKYYDLSGFALELSCFNYFNIGFGYNWGEFKVMYHHFFASDYGFYIEYKTIKELHLRIYYDMYGGSAGMLLGSSGIVATNFEKISVGIAPHIGAGFPGMKIFYRYNFYINKDFNCHEIVLTILRDPNNENRRKDKK